jgi:hypothetical protein
LARRSPSPAPRLRLRLRPRPHRRRRPIDGKIYDGTTTATGRLGTIAGLLDGDVLELGNVRFAFADRTSGPTRFR